MTAITPEAVAKMLEGVTDGPWATADITDWVMAGQMHVAQVRGWGWLTGYGSNGPRLSGEEAIAVQKANARFISYAREAVPALSAERNALAAKLADVDGQIGGLLWVASDNHVALCRAEAAEASNAALTAEVERLRGALGRLGTYETFTTEGWGFTHPEIIARVGFARAALQETKP